MEFQSQWDERDLVRAQKIKVFDCEGNELKGFNALVNEEDESQVMNIVKDDYVIMQHDDVVERVRNTLEDLGIAYNVEKISQTHQGARLRVGVVFPEYEYDVTGKGDIVQMRTDIDNSYNSSTGLRFVVGGYRLICTNGLYVGEKFAGVYHKHTKGIEGINVKETFVRAFDTFNNGFIKYIGGFTQESFTPENSITFLDECLEKKSVPVKYVDLMKDRINHPQLSIDRKTVETKWDFFNVATEVMTHKSPNEDIQFKYTTKIATELAGWIKR